MTTPFIMRCPDGHFRRAIYELAVYIADYLEQVLCTCIVQGWCPKYIGAIESILYSDTKLYPKM